MASVGSKGDSFDNALAETVNGLYKTELIRRRGPWRTVEQVELATLAWVDWWNMDCPGFCRDSGSWNSQGEVGAQRVSNGPSNHVTAIAPSKIRCQRPATWGTKVLGLMMVPPSSSANDGGRH